MINLIVEQEDLRPVLGTEDSAGFDLLLSHDVKIPAGGSIMVGTGVKVEIPKGFMGLVVPRSSTGKKGLCLANTVGIIDSDYQGEIMLNIVNTNTDMFLGYRKDRLFQLVILPIAMSKFVFVDSFSKVTNRGEGGFGSTGN